MNEKNPCLKAEHLKAYQTGFNIFRFTQIEEDASGKIIDEQSEIYEGALKSLSIERGIDSEGVEIIKLCLVAIWIVRVRKAQEYATIAGTFRKNYPLEFEALALEKERGPLTIICAGNVKIEISHVTELVRSVQKTEKELTALGQLESE